MAVPKIIPHNGTGDSDRASLIIMLFLSLCVVVSLSVIFLAVWMPGIFDASKINIITGSSFVAGLLSIAGFVTFSMRRGDKVKRQLRAIDEQNKRNQQAILLLLDEMTNLAEGDLTVHATVTEDITGAIADSVNFSIDALRNLVTTINKTAVKVSYAAVQTQDITRQLTNSSESQSHEIANVTSAINEMASSVQQVSKNANTSAEVAQKSVDIAHKGAQTVSRTIDGMDNIREQIQETSKRIKRLGESSQEIGNIVGLIDEIADQTNILALNAAIQASSAGEAGRGFAVVADEVQRLAERAGNATKQIEALVKTIQTDINEAVSSMEQSTTNVVNGAKLAEDAGEALSEIESVSVNLSGLIQNISTASSRQSRAASNITSTMNVIQDITAQTSASASKTASSVSELTVLSHGLKKSVSGFKLPSYEQAVEEVESIEHQIAS